VKCVFTWNEKYRKVADAGSACFFSFTLLFALSSDLWFYLVPQLLGMRIPKQETMGF
jgi:hypothetical protein